MRPVQTIARLCLAAILLIAVAYPSSAQDVTFPELGAAVPDHPGLTYFDLLKQLVPDLSASATGYSGKTTIPLRHIGGGDYGGERPETIEIFSLSALNIMSGGKKRLALLVDLGHSPDSVEGGEALALYDLDATPSLLDAAIVAFDQNTYFLHPATVAVGGGDEIMVTMSNHFNSSQSYVTSAMMLARADRLTLVDTIFTFDETLCTFTRKQQAAFTPVNGGITGYSDVEVRVVETTEATDGTCEGDPTFTIGSREISTIYRWDDKAGTFIKQSDALEVLRRENEARF